jgi:hypothetical protein
MLTVDVHPEGLVCHHHADLALVKLQLGALPLTHLCVLMRHLALREVARALVFTPL